MRRLVALGIAVALLAPVLAFPSGGDPVQHIVRVDQTLASSMLLRKDDLGRAYAAVPAAGSTDLYCAALDESDLTLTGRAESPGFSAAKEAVASTARLYASRTDAIASWRRAMSVPGRSCLKRGVTRELDAAGGELLAFRQIAFPRLAERSIVFRAVGIQKGVRLYVDLIVLQRGRARAVIVYLSGLEPPSRGKELRLARLTARRMAQALR
jgi:hypothetical protein